MTPHRLATNTDIKESMWYGLDWSDYGWIDKMNVNDNNLIKIDDDREHKDKIKKLEYDIDKKSNDINNNPDDLDNDDLEIMKDELQKIKIY